MRFFNGLGRAERRISTDSNCSKRTALRQVVTERQLGVEALVCRNQLVVSSCVCTSGTLLDVTRVGISRLKRTTISRYKHRCFQFIGRMSHEPRYEAKMRNYAYFVFYHIIRHCSNFTNRSKSSFERRYFRSERIFYLYNYYYIIIIIQFFYLYFAKI